MYKPLLLLALLAPSIAQENNTAVQNQTLAAREDVVEPCTTQEGEKGECVSYYLCQNSTVVTDGVGSIDRRGRSTRATEATPCSSYLDSCCVTNRTRQTTDNTYKARSCGWRNPVGIGFRISGVDGGSNTEFPGETEFGEFPWMVAIVELKRPNASDPATINYFVGGGSIIHPSVVMTVAHFMDKNKNYNVRAGEWDTQTKDEIYPHQDRNVEEIIAHEAFNKKTLFYDIALLILSAPIEPAPNVGVACLPKADDPYPHLAQCFSSGWGKDKFGKGGKYSPILKKTELPVVGRERCQESLQKTSLGENFRLHPSFMCAGGEGKDPCKGDGGSPLVCPIWHEQDRYIQRGIVTWSLGCGSDGVPGVYVDVAVLRPWIDAKMAEKGYSVNKGRL